MSPSQRAHAHSAVLRANDAFYRAFSKGDYAAMTEIWASAAPVACLHPGAPLLSGRKAVLDSWRQLLGAAPAWQMGAREAKVHWLGEVAFVTCLEANGREPAHLIATNIFVWEGERWRMVHHHAGPLTAPVVMRASSELN